MSRNATTLDEKQVNRFNGGSGDRWNLQGPARWLHRYNRVRLPYVLDAACCAFDRDPITQKPLSGLRILDIGCGIGILCEPLARLGASVLGIDPANSAIQDAVFQASRSGLDLTYRTSTAETLASEGERFDVVLAMEVIEHVANHRLFLETCAELTGPQGLLILSTLNRTFTSWLQAIAIGEYVLGLLPRGSHQWSRFVTPQEIRADLEQYGLIVGNVTGVTMKLTRPELRLSRRPSVNYMITARRP